MSARLPLLLLLGWTASTVASAHPVAEVQREEGSAASSDGGVDPATLAPASPPDAGPMRPPAALGAGAPASPSTAIEGGTADLPTRTTVVTATRTARPLRDVPATLTVLPREELQRAPQLLTDEVLRTVPSVATFRRSSSVTADPTSQGLNLRGLGPSGVSRTLVLLDGVPANDPFGGWVYWRALPALGLGRIEIAPQPSSAQYGSAALGGVVQLISAPISRTAVEAVIAAGQESTLFGAAHGTLLLGSTGASLVAEGLTTQGYAPVAATSRGAVDANAPSEHAVARLRVESRLGGGVHLAGSAGYFAESQNGGTSLTRSSVRQGDAALTAALDGGGAGTFVATVFTHVGQFIQLRPRLNADRSIETLAAMQTVPADDEGLGLLWTAPSFDAGGVHALEVGIDGRRVSGTSREALQPFQPSPTALVARTAGGTQAFLGVFAQDVYDPTPALELLGALRLDGWHNADGLLTTVTGDGTTAQRSSEATSQLQLSPKLGARLHLGDALTLRASASRAFRAPTLNELYRPFSLGPVITDPNPALKPETATGAELGIEALPTPWLETRATGFWSTLEQPITNVTLAAPLPDGAQRQRQNLGAARVRGVELEVEARPLRTLTLLASYTFVDARVISAGAVPDLVGKQLAQDPVHRGALGFSFDDPRWLTAVVTARWVGPQYEDDQNQLGMAGFVTVDASLSTRLTAAASPVPLELFVSVENLFNRSYLVGRTGVDTLGQPLFARVGLRLR